MKIYGVRKIILVEEILFKDLFYIFSNKLNKCFKNTLKNLIIYSPSVVLFNKTIEKCQVS